MGSIVLELQQELLQQDCDIVNALRKAHLIAAKLKLSEFDAWLQNELNGYTGQNDQIPEYRNVCGVVKLHNPINGWIPVIFEDQKEENLWSHRKIFQSISEIIGFSAANNTLYIPFPGNLSQRLSEAADAPIVFEAGLFITKESLTAICEKVKTCLLEWTLKLEEKGIVGENMTFNETESANAREIPQQVNHYYGTVIHGNVSGAQIISGNNHSVTYNATAVADVVKEIRKSLEQEKISGEDMESALELLDEISDKLEQGKKPSIIKSALIGLKDFTLATGANVTAALITAKIQGLY